MERSIPSWKVVGEVRAATLATSGLAADDVSAFSLPNDSLPRHTFLHRFGQRWSSISSELSRVSTCRRIRYRRFSQLGGLWASCANTPRSSAFRSSLHGHVHTTLKVEVALISRYGSGSLKIRLRPLRLAFLVHEADEAAILTAMETCRSLQ